MPSNSLRHRRRSRGLSLSKPRHRRKFTKPRSVIRNHQSAHQIISTSKHSIIKHGVHVTRVANPDYPGSELQILNSGKFL